MAEPVPERGAEQGGSGKVKLWYNTWGSFGQYSVAIAVLRDGTVVDPRTFRVPRKTSVKKQLGGTEVEVVNDSSSKNAHIYVYVPAEAVKAVLSFTKTSSGGKGWNVDYGDGEIEVVEEEERKEEARNGRRVLVTRKYYTYYYVEGDWRVPFSRELASTTETPLDKPRVVVRTGAETIAVEGDTYEIKEVLKQLGFRWNGYRWEKAKGTLEEVVVALKDVAEVEVRNSELFEALVHIEKAHELLSRSTSPDIVRLADQLHFIILTLRRVVGSG